ncbi:uncharacterized protein LOC127835179 [Dreissena polymorpha]|uniref:Uncharacterized protein n=1 Tax=Dreissena polymorpha TaxID=45954 RepID=A0A9D4GB31_DREPO|nr:uncharacterized protein LOC127835179 [Dreissena polymorpha]KAH3813668.1 hypothetical protein DPMN_142133 [Dreissena polymorpha]
MDGIFMWNSDRASEAITNQPETQVVPVTYSGPLKHHTNMLWQELCGRLLFPDFKPPGKYTGELVGIQYLYDQTGHELPGLDQTRNQLEKDEDENVADDLEDEGFVEQPGISLPGENVEFTFVAGHYRK